MWVKLLSTDSSGNDQFVDTNINYNDISGYWIIPLFVDEELDLTVESEEMGVFLYGNTLILKVNQELIKLLDSKL
jgi:hypothetical protein